MVKVGLFMVAQSPLFKTNEMQIVLYINGVTKHKEDCDLVFANAFREQRLMKNVIERIHLMYRQELMKADFWEIFIYQKSSMK